MTFSVQLESVRRLGDATYRVEWLGDLVKTRKTNSLTKCVRVVCSEWKEGDGNATMAARRAEPLYARVPVAFLRFLRIGDLWRNGEYIGSTETECRTYEKLVVDGETTRTQLAGAASLWPSGVRRHDLPFDAFDGHKTCTGAWMVRVQVSEKEALLIPGLEIARFYFGRSGVLVSKVFEDSNPIKQLCKTIVTDPDSGEVSVELMPGVTSNAACDAVRLELDARAKRLIRTIAASCAKSSVNFEANFPRVPLPFEGETRLQVRGRSITVGEETVFLVHFIESCGMPLPFNALKCHLWMNPPVAKDSAVPVQPTAVEAAPAVVVPRTPHPSLGRLEDAFPDLRGKRIERVVHNRSSAPVSVAA